MMESKLNPSKNFAMLFALREKKIQVILPSRHSPHTSFQELPSLLCFHLYAVKKKGNIPLHTQRTLLPILHPNQTQESNSSKTKENFGQVGQQPTKILLAK